LTVRRIFLNERVIGVQILRTANRHCVHYHTLILFINVVAREILFVGKAEETAGIICGSKERAS